MRNVFLFIRKYSNFLLFLLLQITALSFLFRYNKYHEAAFMNVAGEFTGSINQRYSKVENYFRLKKINEQLAAENCTTEPDAQGKLSNGWTGMKKSVMDTVQTDSLREIRKYTWLGAKVVGRYREYAGQFYYHPPRFCCRMCVRIWALSVRRVSWVR